MRRFLLGGLVGLALAGVAGADGAVQISTKTTSDRLEVTVQSSGTLTPTVKTVGGHLQLQLGKASLKSGGGTTRLDKGLLQKLEVVGTASDGLTVNLYSISVPKNSLKLGPGNHSLVWTVSVNDLADSGVKTIDMLKPTRPAANPHPTPPPVAAATPRPTPPPITAATPPPVAAATPPPIPVVTPTPAPPVPAPTPEPTPAVVGVADRLVSLTYTQGDLPGALRALAKSAGIEADIEPGVTGFVTVSFRDVPLNKAITTVLGQQEALYNYSLSETRLKVFGNGEAVTRTPAVNLPPDPAHKLSREYFPIKDQKAAKVVDALRRTLPGLNYTVDDRLNVIMAEGDPHDLERLRKLLQKVSVK